MVLHPAFSFRSRRPGQLGAALGFGVCAALSTELLLSPPMFRTGATIGVDDAVGRFSSEAVRTAADLAVSRPVLVRAATSLIETHAMASPLGLLERFGVLATTNSATERAVKLADQLHAAVHPTSGAGSVTLDIIAEAPDAAQAARAATAVANALVAFRDDNIAEMRHSRDIASASRIAALRSAALTAHRRLTALAGTDVEPSQARASSVDQTAEALARVAALRAIIASGTPPLGDGKAMPQSVETLQTAYLDLTRKLAVASETLGNRHMTIIALQDGIRHAGVALTAEWKRLLRIAEADLAAARQRDASFGKADAAPDINRQAAIDEARQTARVADEAVARAEAQREPAVDEPAYRLIASAPVPLTAAAGWSLLARVLMSLAAGAAAALARLALSRGKRAPSPEADIEPRFEAVPSRATHPAHEVEPDRPSSDVMADTPDFFDAEPEAEPMLAKDMSMPQTTPPPTPRRTLDPDLQDALGEIVAELVMAEPANGAVPTIMVAANEIASDTMNVALSLADVAVERGMRVLVVEGPRQKPELAAAAEPDCEPMLVDLFGGLRIVLQAEISGALFVAPFFKNGASIAAALARNTQIPFLDDVAAEFDIIIVDGCRASDSAAAGLSADAYLRVGRFTSRRETDRFLKTLDVAADLLVGTIANSMFVPREPDRASWRAPRPVVSPAPTAPGGPVMPPQAGAYEAGGFQGSVPTVSSRPAYPRRAAAR